MRTSESRKQAKDWGLSREVAAGEWLKSRPGVRILERGFRIKGGEIDWIVEEWDGKAGEWILVFVEVRARSELGWVTPEASVTGEKRHRLRRAIHAYLRRYTGPACEIRYDLLAWGGERGAYAWTWMKGAW